MTNTPLREFEEWCRKQEVTKYNLEEILIAAKFKMRELKEKYNVV